MGKGHYLTLLIVSLVGFCYTDDTAPDTNLPASTQTWADKLKKDLLVNYDRTLRPAQHYNVTNVDVKLTIRHVDVDEESSIFSVYGWIKMNWLDQRIMWDPAEYGGVQSLIIPSYFLWDPELNMHSTTLESAGSMYYSSSNIRIESNGMQHCLVRVHLKTFCEMNFRKWPFDTQHCSMVLGKPVVREDDAVIMNAMQGDLNELIHSSPSWRVTDMFIEAYEDPIEDKTRKFSGVQYGIIMQRKTEIFQSTVIAPAVVFILMTLINFWLPPSASEKILLNCINAAIVCAFLLYFTIHLPLLATRTPLVVLFFSNSLYLTAFCLILSVIVVNMVKSKHRKPIHPYIKALINLPGMSCLVWTGNNMKDWIDEKLKWNPANYGNLDLIRTHPDTVWKPDLVLYNNAKGSDNLHYGKTNVIIYNNGKVLWVPPTDYHGFCELNLRMWPFDYQTCFLKIGSWTYDGYKLNLTSNENPEIDISVANNEWSIRKVTTNRNIVYYTCCTEPYIDVQYNVTLQRHSATHKAIVISPAFVIILLALSVFWLPPHCGEKIVLNGIIVLIVTVFLIYFAQLMPAMSGTTPLIVTFFSTTLYLVAISTIISIIVLRITRIRQSQPVPRSIKGQLDGCLGTVLGLRTNGNLPVEEDKEAAGGEIGDSKHRDWCRVAALIDRLAFVVYLVIFVFSAIYYSL